MGCVVEKTSLESLKRASRGACYNLACSNETTWFDDPDAYQLQFDKLQIMVGIERACATLHSRTSRNKTFNTYLYAKILQN